MGESDTSSIDHLVMREFVSGPPRYRLTIRGFCEQFVVLEQSSGLQNRVCKTFTTEHENCRFEDYFFDRSSSTSLRRSVLWPCVCVCHLFHCASPVLVSFCPPARLVHIHRCEPARKKCGDYVAVVLTAVSFSLPLPDSSFCVRAPPQSPWLSLNLSCHPESDNKSLLFCLSLSLAVTVFHALSPSPTAFLVVPSPNSRTHSLSCALSL